MAAPAVKIPTRERILDATEKLVLRLGYSGTSIDRIIGDVGITKGAFFYHFASKDELAAALLERFARSDGALLDETMARAERLGREPLEQLLLFVGLMIEVMEAMPEAPGCLFAAYCYESGQFRDDVMKLVADALLKWRVVIADKLRAVAKRHPPRVPVDFDSLADMFTVQLEGAYVMARVFNQPRALAEQLQHYRAYLQLLFEGPPVDAPRAKVRGPATTRRR